MLLETVGFAVIGLVVGFGAGRILAGRLPSQALVRTTGPVAALCGGWVAHVVLGPGHAPGTLLVAAAVSVALVTVLVRPDRRAPVRHRAPRRAKSSRPARVHP